MTSPAEQIEVLCPQCGKLYKGWYRPSINMSLGEEWSDEDLDKATSTTCPHCHFKVSHGGLIIGKNGVWHIKGGDAPGSLILRRFHGNVGVNPQMGIFRCTSGE